MRQDKSLLIYRQKPQRYHVYELLSHFSNNVYLSINPGQEGTVEEGYPYITDLPEYQDIGPMAGILSAFYRLPDKNILFVGCDYPHLDEAELNRFISFITIDKPAAFFSETAATYEPLLAWYPCSHANLIRDQFRKGNYSLRQFLVSSDAGKYSPQNPLSLFSVDTADDYLCVYKSINGG